MARNAGPTSIPPHRPPAVGQPLATSATAEASMLAAADPLAAAMSRAVERDDDALVSDWLRALLASAGQAVPPPTP
jgi:hypothetical protein